MADIDIERKSVGIWPWILGLLLLALLIWAAVEWMGDDEEVSTVPVTGDLVAPLPVVIPPAADAGELPAGVQEYLATCTGAAGSMGLDHAFTSNCIQRLQAAVDAVLLSPAASGIQVEAELQDARQKAQRLTGSPTASAEHAGMTRDAFTSLATLMDRVQEARFPALDDAVDRVEAAAESVQPGPQLLEQRDAVHRFFTSAGEALRAMSTAR